MKSEFQGFMNHGKDWEPDWMPSIWRAFCCLRYYAELRGRDDACFEALALGHPVNRVNYLICQSNTINPLRNPRCLPPRTKPVTFRGTLPPPPRESAPAISRRCSFATQAGRKALRFGLSRRRTGPSLALLKKTESLPSSRSRGKGIMG
jgi:hypothetical protein